MLEGITLVLLAFQCVIFVYFIVVNGVYTLFIALSLREIRRYAATVISGRLTSFLSGMWYRPISILVPAYNEESTIVANVRSLLALHYPEFEVIVINDGSQDNTLGKLLEEFRLEKIDQPICRRLQHKRIKGVYASAEYPSLVVVDKENGGKADALNAGINVSRFPLFCCIDADSILENESLVRASRLFVEDMRVIATGGIVRVLNGCRMEKGMVQEVRAPRRAIECFQAVEYTRGFLSGRTSWNVFGSLLLISGAFGVFRKDMVLEIGGYRANTVGEDMDLVVRLHRYCRSHKIPYKVVFVPDPVCWTQVPSDLLSLLKQRNRWQRGLIDSLWFSKEMFCNPRYGAAGLLGYPYYVFVEALGPLVEFCGYFGFILFFLFGYVNRDVALLFFVVAVLWGMWINVGSILLDNWLYKRYKGLKDILILCFYSVVEFAGYRQVIATERLFATFQVWKRSWGKPKRQEISSGVYKTSV